jgi:hypothetical protein
MALEGLTRNRMVRAESGNHCFNTEAQRRREEIVRTLAWAPVAAWPFPKKRKGSRTGGGQRGRGELLNCPLKRKEAVRNREIADSTQRHRDAEKNLFRTLAWAAVVVGPFPKKGLGNGVTYFTSIRTRS